MWGGSLSRMYKIGISVFLVIRRVAQSPGLRGPPGEAGGEGLTLTAEPVTLVPRQGWFQSLRTAGGRLWCVGSTEAGVVPASRWSELHVEGDRGRACSRHRMDPGRRRVIGVQAGPGRGWASGRPERTSKVEVSIFVLLYLTLSLHGHELRVWALCL